MAIQTPYSTFQVQVSGDWIDYNGHMNVGYYLVAFDLAAEPFFDWLGFTTELRKNNNVSTFALETHLNFLREVKEGDEIRFETRLIDYDGKRVHFFQEMYQVEQNYLAASHESLGAYIDMEKRKTTTMPEQITQRLDEVLQAHQTLENPWQVGHKISIKKS